MRICPKCGHVDPPCWRSMKFRRYTDYAYKSELPIWEPGLLEKLLLQNTITLGNYRYHLTKAGYVHRICLRDLANPSNPRSVEEPDTEKPKNRLHIETWKLEKFI